MNFQGISMEQFYIWGFYILAFNAVWNTITLIANVVNWVYYYWWGIFPNIGSVLFSWCLAGFFLYLKNMVKPSISDEEFLTKFGKEEN